LPDPVLRERNTLECAKVKGERFEDTIFNLDPATRWFVSAGAAPKGPSPYEQVVGVFNGKPLQRSAILELLPKLSPDTIDRQLKASVKTGDLTKQKNGRAVEYKKRDVPHDPHAYRAAEHADNQESVENIEDSLDFEWPEDSDQNDLADYQDGGFEDSDAEILEAIDR
jgi:hypothetical protein